MRSSKNKTETKKTNKGLNCCKNFGYFINLYFVTVMLASMDCASTKNVIVSEAPGIDGMESNETQRPINMLGPYS